MRVMIMKMLMVMVLIIMKMFVVVIMKMVVVVVMWLCCGDDQITLKKEEVTIRAVMKAAGTRGLPSAISLTFRHRASSI